MALQKKIKFYGIICTFQLQQYCVDNIRTLLHESEDDSLFYHFSSILKKFYILIDLTL